MSKTHYISIIIIHSNSHVLNHTGESIEVLDIGLRRTGGVPVVQRVKPPSPTHRLSVGSPPSPTHRLSVGSPRRHNAISSKYFPSFRMNKI